MIKINKFYWFLPLIGGIISIFGIFIPAWYSITVYDENVWMWGLIERITVSEFDFLHAELLIPGLIAVILIVISSIAIIISTSFVVRGKIAQTSAEKLWIIAGFFELCTAIIYIVAIEIIFYSFTQSIGYPEHDFWRVYNFHFGMITPFIGAVFSIVGAIIGVLIKKK